MITYDNDDTKFFLLFLSQPCGYSFWVAKKDFLAFRINPDLKQQIEEIANEEQRSISQICELFLKGAIAQYRKEGPQFIRGLLAQQKDKTK